MRNREIEFSINRALSSLKPHVIHKGEKLSDSETVYHVFALGFYTHKIRLTSQEEPRPHPTEKPEIAILIDDIGHDLEMARSFMQLGLPVTLSILPLASDTHTIVQMAKGKGCEYMLHLPMEPKEYPYLDPGPGALFAKTGDEEIRQTLGDHLKRVPGARGVNNHMGSEFTENEEKMTVLLHEIKKRELFYVDSRTTSHTVAQRVAKTIGVPVASRTVFLDNDLSPKAMEFQMGRLLAAAREPGAAIGIGHPHRETLDFLKKRLQETKSEAKVVLVSQIVG